MNFQLAGIGHSFRGSMAYYLHDKRAEEGGAHPTTSERVAWTETRNLPTDGPHTATRVMIATASQSEELKAAAGIKATGRKATAGPVFAFSLQWRADELDGVQDRRAEMTRAADHALKTLGLDDRQAILVAHSDRAHPHVHVICSRVSPEDGRMAKIDPNKVRALDKWANDYEHGRGKVVSPNRAEKFERIERKQRAHPDPEARRAYIVERERRRKEGLAARVAKAKRQADPSINPAKPEPTPAAILKALGDDQRARHKAAWSALAERGKAERSAIYRDFGARIQAATAQRKELARPLWAQHFRQVREEAGRFAARERETLGLISNALTAAKQQMARGEEPGRGMLSLTFANVLSAERRGQAFAAHQETRRIELARQLGRALDSDVAALKLARADALAGQRASSEKARKELIEVQAGDRQKMREAWRQLHAREGRQPYYRAGLATRSIMESQTMREDFDKARRMEQPKPARQETERRHVSQPAPAPSPPGTPAPPKRTVQDVPKRAEPTMPDVKQAPTPTKDWNRAAPPANSTPERDWAAKPEPAREIKPLPQRDRDRTRER